MYTIGEIPGNSDVIDRSNAARLITHSQLSSTWGAEEYMRIRSALSKKKTKKENVN